VNPQFVQVPCGKCGATVWISPAAGVGYCPQCHTPNSLPPGGAQAAQPGAYGGQGAQGAQPGAYGAPQQPGAYGQPGQQPGGFGQPGQPGQQPGASYPGAVAGPAGMAGRPMAFAVPAGPSKLKIIGGVVLAAVLGIGWTVVKYVIKPKTSASTKDLGISDQKKADPMKAIEGTKTLAKKWRSDAEFHGINILAMNTDGTIDLTKSNMVVEWYSPSRVTSSSAKGREDSVKKFAINDDRVDYASLWGATKPWQGVKPTPIPKCTTEKLAKQLAKTEKWKSGTVHVAIDPNWGHYWHVLSSSPQINKWYDLDSCEEITDEPEESGDEE
jgi:hypothetical protein